MYLPRLAAAAMLAAALTGCASIVAPPYSADYDALDRLKRVAVDKVSVDTFEPTDVSAPVNRISLRAANLVSPHPTFAQYLELALKADLSEIGLLDAASPIRLKATLLKNDIDISGFQTGTGTMEVDLVVMHGPMVRLRKTYRASTSFESSFAGAVAISRGQIEYPRLVRALLGQVYSDTAFIDALKPQGQRP